MRKIKTKSKDLDIWSHEGIIIENDERYYFSHPSVLKLENGYRLIYQVNKENSKEGVPGHLSIWSTYSQDGENWEKEGGLVIGSNESRFANAAHGSDQRLTKIE